MSYLCKILSPKRKRRKIIDPHRVMLFNNIEECLLNIEKGEKKRKIYSHLFSAKLLHNKIKYLTPGEKEKYVLWFDYLEFLAKYRYKKDSKEKSRNFRKKVVNKVKKRDIYYQ